MAIDPDVQDQLDGVYARLRDLETSGGGGNGGAAERLQGRCRRLSSASWATDFPAGSAARPGIAARSGHDPGTIGDGTIGGTIGERRWPAQRT